jgi:superoxide dismutase, Fe-Mn family
MSSKENPMKRREALAAMGGSTLVLAGAAMGQKAGVDAGTPSTALGSMAFAGVHKLKPLPFNPAKLKGLSEKLLVSHHENNYGGAVKNLNKVEQELGRLTKETPAFIFGGLKERELTFSNSVTLHELYFGNLGGNGKPSGAIEKALTATYGSFGRWEEEFRAIGGSLGGGSGWAVLNLTLSTGEIRSQWSGNHTQVPALSQPLLVMDMYEHAYALDYAASAARYIDAFFANIQWDEVNARLERGLKALASLRT